MMDLAGMINPMISFGRAIGRIRGIIWHANSDAGTNNRRNNLRYERKVNSIYRCTSIDCSGVRRGRIVDRIIVRVKAERNVIGNPEDSVAAANNSLGVVAVGKADAG